MDDLKNVIDGGREDRRHLSTDELEAKNLPPQAAGLAKQLKSRLDAWEMEVAAPITRSCEPGTGKSPRPA